MDSRDLVTAASWITNSNNVVAFTGAGISVESGIPDFRSPGGLWSKFDPAIYCDFSRFQSNPELFWEMSREMQSTIANAEPNPAHVTLAEMEKQNLVSCVITQNIDNLHKLAGSAFVFELHGNAATSSCTMCHEKFPTVEAIAQFQDQDSKVPKCKICAGVMKMDVILFGEALTNSILEGAMAVASTADVVLVIGSSLTEEGHAVPSWPNQPSDKLKDQNVSPANMIVKFCQRRSGRVIIVDPDPNIRLQGDLLLCGPAGVVLPQLLQACLANRNGKGKDCVEMATIFVALLSFRKMRGKPQEKENVAAPLENVAEIKNDLAVLDAPETPSDIRPAQQPNENEPHSVNPNAQSN